MLVAMAGTHGVSASHDESPCWETSSRIPRYRNSHFALQATGAVTRELLETCDEVVLTVDPANEPAVSAYTRLGYRDDCRLIETAVTRRETAGDDKPGPAARRALARPQPAAS